MGAEAWAVPPPAIGLPMQAVHLWRVELDGPPDNQAQLAVVLDPAEQARAARFAQPRHQQRYAVTRGALRWLLAGYTGVAPTDIRFGYGRYGKPHLIQPLTALTFNVAHSHDMALIGVTVGRELGVDIEFQRDVPELESIARRYFAPGEISQLLAAPPAARPAAFLRIWTRKEAFIKAIGEGLSHPLAAFEVSLGAGATSCLAQVGADPLEASYWSLIHLEPAPGYVGAAAWRAREWAVSTWQFDPAQPRRGFEWDGSA